MCGTNIWKVGSDGPTLTPSYIYHTYICIKLLGLYVLVVVVWYQYVLCAQYQSKHIITHAPACYVFWDLWCSLLLVNTYVYLECATCCWSVWPLIFYRVKFGLCVELLSGASTLSICSKQKSESSNENVNENENIVRSIQRFAVLNALKERTLALLSWTSHNSSIDHRLHHQKSCNSSTRRYYCSQPFNL